MNDDQSGQAMRADIVALDRFACGEMTGDEEAGFLARCEIEPERWRAATLACVEHRRLVAALAGRSATTWAGSLPRETRRGLRWSQVAAVAVGIACVVCGMAAGYRLGRNRTTPLDAVAVDTLGQRPATGGALVFVEQALDPLDHLLPPAARQVLEEAGIEVHEEPVCYLVDGRNGDHWLIPETQLELRVRGHMPHAP